MMSTATITPHNLAEQHRQQNAVTLIDVRTPAEFREVHIEFARNVPLDQLSPKQFMESRPEAAAQPLFVVCQRGGRGRQACEKFRAAGFDNVINVEGGTDAWVGAGFPVRRGQSTMSLERQVRIAAGMMVLLGAGLGYFLDSRWIGLSAFVGAGLIFAGITDSCAMGMLIAKMPWNQVRNSGAGACQV